jgi:hypothetical protein
MGATCGRREREADAGNGEERSFHAPVVATVEGTPIHGMPAAFAGCRKNVGLGRSVSSVWGSFPCSRSHRRQQVPSGRRGGERRQRTPSARTLRGDAQQAPSTLEDTSFARSRDPCTSIVTQLQRRKSREVARSVRYRGRANLRKQEEPAPGSKRSDACAARRASPLHGATRGGRA